MTAVERPTAFSLWLNGLPLLLLSVGGGVAFTVAADAGQGLALLAAWVYLLPPLLSRLLILACGRPVGRLSQDQPAYRVWWTLTQLQMLFNRLPWLEEPLRLVPGLYALWIGLWGGRLSPLAFVGPGVVITDRHLVEIGRGAVLGMRSALAGHMVLLEAGRWVVVAAAPVVEPQALLGGTAGLGPGAVLRAGHMLPAGRRLGPFDQWPRPTEAAP